LLAFGPLEQRAEVAEVALAYQFGISYDTYNLVADPEVTYSITPKRAH